MVEGEECGSEEVKRKLFLPLETIIDKRIDTKCDTKYNIELRKVLENYGYEMNSPRNGSSHFTFRKPGCQPITIPKHEPIKKVYVEMVRQIVESEAENDEDAE